MTQSADDALTVSAIAVLAACIAAVAHEAIGHGGACLALGGAITQLTSVYFQCSAHNLWIPAAGPLGNLAAALLAGAGAALLPGARTRLLLVLIALISIYWFAGYLIYAALLNDGDPYFVLADFGAPNLAARAGMAAAGLAAYAIGLWASRRFTAPMADAQRTLGVAWVAASLSACAAALVYAPDRLDAVKQAALEIGAASLPMLLRSAPGPRTTSVAIARDWAWIGAAAAAFVVFAATLGRGL